MKRSVKIVFVITFIIVLILSELLSKAFGVNDFGARFLVFGGTLLVTYTMIIYLFELEVEDKK